MQFITRLPKLQLQVHMLLSTLLAAVCNKKLIRQTVYGSSMLKCSDNPTALVVNISQRLASAWMFTKKTAERHFKSLYIKRRISGKPAAAGSPSVHQARPLLLLLQSFTP